MIDAKGRKLGEQGFAHGGEGLAEMAAWIVKQTGTAPDAVSVAIEVPHGPVVESLMERGFRVHSINPKQLDRFRDRFSPAGAKDDSRDAHVLADALRTDSRCLRRLEPLDPIIVELREWSRIGDDLRHDRNRLGNRVRELLWRYYPQMLELADDVAASWSLEFWRLVPTPDKAKKIREGTVARLLKSHRIRRFTAAQALQLLRATPVTVAPGTVSAATAHLEAVAKRLQLVNRQIADADPSVCHPNLLRRSWALAHSAQLDRLTEKLAEADDTPGQDKEQRDVTILGLLSGSEALRCEAFGSLVSGRPAYLHAAPSRVVLLVDGWNFGIH